MKRAAEAAVLVAVLAAAWILWPRDSAKPAPAIPDVGQLTEAASAYSANQADGNGLTVTSQRVLDERLLPDGRAVVRLEVWTEGGTVNHFIEWVTLKRHLWIGQEYRLCPVQPRRVCR